MPIIGQSESFYCHVILTHIAGGHFVADQGHATGQGQESENAKGHAQGVCREGMDG